MKNRSEINKRYYEKHKEEIRLKRKQTCNKEYYKANYAAWLEFNRDYKKEYDRKRYLEKKEKVKEKFIVSFD